MLGETHVKRGDYETPSLHRNGCVLWIILARTGMLINIPAVLRSELFPALLFCALKKVLKRFCLECLSGLRADHLPIFVKCTHFTKEPNTTENGLKYAQSSRCVGSQTLWLTFWVQVHCRCWSSAVLSCLISQLWCLSAGNFFCSATLAPPPLALLLRLNRIKQNLFLISWKNMGSFFCGVQQRDLTFNLPWNGKCIKRCRRPKLGS